LNYWLGITTTAELIKNSPDESWWCLPQNAQVGDAVLFYCPRSHSAARQGIFAEYVVTKAPVSRASARNSPCLGYGYGKQLAYTELARKKRFDPALTAKEMKKDQLLANSNFVRRGFQATTFQLAPSYYKQIELLLKSRVTAKPRSAEGAK